MSKDISKVLEGWDFDPDQLSVRIVEGDDGREKIQVRVDLGVLQIEFEGRPDGRRIEGCDSWFEYYQRQQKTQDSENPDGVPFCLETADCERLLREGVQYYHRYISFWHLERYELCARDTSRNLKLFAFVREHARHTRDKLRFDQWRPYVTMMHTRAVATPLVLLDDFEAALRVVDAGIAGINRFLEEYGQAENAENCGELAQLQRWREELVAHRPTKPQIETRNPLALLQEALDQAVGDERFEEAARLRDEIRRRSDGGL